LDIFDRFISSVIFVFLIVYVVALRSL